jgi:5-methylcytosine-specific restriction endonuclease McrA
MAKTPRIKIDPAVRQFVLDRDNHQCQSCGCRDRLEIDHIKALAAGGSNDISNLHTLCRNCNARKRDRLDLRFDRRFNL